MGKVATVVIEVDANTAKLIEGFKRSERATRQLKRSVNNAKREIASIKNAVVGVAAVAASFLGAKSAVNSFLDTASQFENYENRMTAFTQSQGEANSEMQRSIDFAKQWKLDIAETTEAMLTLKNYGIDDSNESLKIFTNTAIGSGKSLSQYAEAVADALTGENERLKEFGVKASKLGEKIGYVWTDSSGKTRNVIIENNKEIINSTLNAIMNEKYVGQIEKHSQSWAGLYQGIANKWTEFKLDIADAGLLNYFKALAKTVINTLGVAFGETGGIAAGMAKLIMDGIASLIRGAGSVYDAWNGTSLVWEIIKNGALEAFVAINEAIDKWPQAFSDRGVDIQNSFGTTITTIKKLWYGMINYLGKEWNEFYSDWALGVNKISEKIGSDFRLNIPTFTPTVVEDFKKIEYSQRTVSSETKYWKDKLKESDVELKKIYATVANETGTKKANEFLKNLNENFKSMGQTVSDITKQKEAANKALKDLDAGYGGLSESATKSEAAQKKALKEAQKEAKRLQDHLDAVADSIASLFREGFEEIFRGNFSSGISSMINNVIDNTVVRVSNAFSTGIGNIFSGAGGFTDAFKSITTGDWIGTAVSFVGGLLSNSLSESEIRDAAGESSFDSKALSNIQNILETNQAPQLTATRAMLRHIESMDSNFGSIANALSSSSGFDFDGSQYESTASSNWWGGKSTELLGSGIKFGEQTIAGFLKGVDAVGYQAEKVTKSSFFGLVNKESIRETEIGLDSRVKEDLQKAMKHSIDAVLESAKIIGFDASSIKAQLDQFALDLGKVNFKDLNAEEKAQALKDAFSGQLNNAFESAINTIASPRNIEALNQMAQVGEEYTATLVRAAVQHETVSTQLALFNQTVTDFATSDVLVQAAGGLDKFKNAMQIFTTNFFSKEEQQAMKKQQLEMALAVQNIALPASKAQFRALVLETQQKIISTKANIETMKASIRADIEANNFKKLADESYARSAISTANNINKAAILIGTSAHEMVEAAKGAAVEAQSIDYTAAYEADVGLQALEGELSNLESIYATLMENMGAFADYYGGVESAAKDAASKAQEEARKAQEKLNEKRREQIELINKEISLRNKLNSTIASMQESVYDSFEKLLGKDVPQLVNNLRSAINNKEYEKVSGAFNDYSSTLSDTAINKEVFLRGIIGANALVQKIQGQEQMSLLDASLATEANTRETAYLQRISMGLQKSTLVSNEKENKLDENNKLLRELIALQKISNEQGATGLTIEEERRRDEIAADLRARHMEAS